MAWRLGPVGPFPWLCYDGACATEVRWIEDEMAARIAANVALRHPRAPLDQCRGIITPLGLVDTMWLSRFAASHLCVGIGLPAPPLRKATR